MLKLIFQMLKEKSVIKSNIEGKEIIIYDPNYFMQNIYPNIIIECQDKIKEFFSDFEEKEKYSYVRIKTDYKVLYDKISGFNNRFIEGDVWLEFYIDRNLFNFNEPISSLIKNLNAKIIICNSETKKLNLPKNIYCYFKVKE